MHSTALMMPPLMAHTALESTVDISAQFAFDFDYGAEMTGGTVYVNGEQVYEITESMMGGQGGMGGRGGVGSSGAAPSGMSGDPRSGKSASA